MVEMMLMNWPGSDEMVSMNDMADMAMDIAASLGVRQGKMPINHIPGPEGVRGRNSNNDLIKKVGTRRRIGRERRRRGRFLLSCLQVLGWAPSISLKDGLTRTAPWILKQIEADKAQGEEGSIGRRRKRRGMDRQCFEDTNACLTYEQVSTSLSTPPPRLWRRKQLQLSGRRRSRHFSLVLELLVALQQSNSKNGIFEEDAERGQGILLL
eukprot:749851-Hanusia_phi.AAC.1